jgi:hypothetical protein
MFLTFFLLTLAYGTDDSKDTTKNKNMDEVTVNIPTQVQFLNRLLEVYLSFDRPKFTDCFASIRMIPYSDFCE